MIDVINNNLNNVKAEVEEVLSTSPLIIRSYTKHLLKGQGKYIRAISVLTSAMDDNHEIHPDAIHFAAAIEILHLATLVHDDVMDGADYRRGISTLHKEYGHKTAIICGDYLLAVALNLVNKTQQKHEYLDYDLSNYMLEIALGELTQHLNNGNYNIKVTEYLEIIRGKTAALFEASFVAGILSTGDASALESYKLLGHNLGMIFQLVDDCIDFEVSDEDAKKPTQSDFEQGVITLPLISALEKAGRQFKQLTRLEVNALVKEYGGLEMTKEKAQSYYDQAQTILNDMNLDAIKKNVLQNLFDLAMGYLND